MRIGIEDLSFDSTHYTEGISEKCKNLHGHTFTVDVEVEWNIDEETGMVIDFGKIKEIAGKVLEEWDHKLLVFREEAEKIKIEGPFNCELKVMYGIPTTENIATSLKKEFFEELRLPVRVKVYEGKKNYARSKFSG